MLKYLSFIQVCYQILFQQQDVFDDIQAIVIFN